MPHNAAFHQGLHLLLIQNLSLQKKNQYFLEIITSIDIMDHPDLTVSNFMENAISLTRVKGPAVDDDFCSIVLQFLKR